MAASVLSLAAVFLGSCAENRQPECFVVRVDSASAPDSVQAGEVLAIGLWGTIGYDGRYQFSHSEAQVAHTELDLTVWGKFTPADEALGVVTKLRGKQYNVGADTPGSFRIRIHQPDGGILRDSVLVRP